MIMVGRISKEGWGNVIETENLGPWTHVGVYFLKRYDQVVNKKNLDLKEVLQYLPLRQLFS